MKSQQSRIELVTRPGLQQAQEKEQDYSEWRLNKVQEAMAERNAAKRKRARMDNDEHEMESEAKNLKLSDLQTQLDDKCRDVTQVWPLTQFYFVRFL